MGQYHTVSTGYNVNADFMPLQYFPMKISIILFVFVPVLLLVGGIVLHLTYISVNPCLLQQART